MPSACYVWAIESNSFLLDNIFWAPELAENHHKMFWFGLWMVALGWGLLVPTASLWAQDRFVHPITTELEFPGNLVSPEDGSGRIFIIEHHLGTIRIVRNGRLLAEKFVDLSDRITRDPSVEQGLLALAFPPEFPEKKHVYVTYTNRNNRLVLSRFQVSEDTSRADESSEEILLSTDKWSQNHHCGHIAFSPKDKFLYYCVGDSDLGGNPLNTGQNLGALQGKILRLDVESGQKPYAIPSDNPFIGVKDVMPEIWAYGLRNPWMFSFDPLTGDLYLPDVGWDFREEISFQPAASSGGENYGWNLAEGNQCLKECDDENLIWPFFEYSHGELGCAVVGGMVYRGRRRPDWSGVYLFGDHCNGRIYAVRNLDDDPSIRLIEDTSLNPTAIAPGPGGEALVAEMGQGGLYRLSFPEDFRNGWEPVPEMMFRWMLSARRSNTRAAEIKALMDRISYMRNTKRWRWTEPLAKFYSFLRKLFE